MTVGFCIMIVVLAATVQECQQIHNGENVTDFQQAQSKKTIFEVNFFSDVRDTDVEMNKMNNIEGCPKREQRLPPLLLGLHFLEIVALALLTLHTVFHGHTLCVFLKKALLKKKQEQAEAALAKAEADRLRMKEEVDKEVAARMKLKEKVEAKYNPDINLA